MDYDQDRLAGTPPAAAEPLTLFWAVRGGVPLSSRLTSHYLFISLSVKLVLSLAEGSPFNLTGQSLSISSPRFFLSILSDPLLFIAIYSGL